MTEHNEKILILEDNKGFAETLEEELRDEGYEVVVCSTLADAVRQLKKDLPDLVLSDLRLPDGSGSDFFEWVSKENPRPAFLILTAFGSIAEAVAALKTGVDNYLTKPIDFDHLRLTIYRALEVRRLREEVNRYRAGASNAQSRGFHGILGQSPVMQQMFEQIRRISQTQEPVLITGESGVGKELVARSIHKCGPRAKGPFIAVNCAGFPKDLIESELFGYMKGAFTGAAQDRAGLFSEAAGGTLFLDEIGELPLEMQAKLLRVVQERAFRPVGGTEEKAVDVHIVAATNRNLQEEIAENRFREDLFFRLDTFAVEVPPLRKRGQDIDQLIAHFVAEYSTDSQKQVPGIDQEALEVLRAYTYPGNVRELQSILRRCLLFAEEGKPISKRHLPQKIVGTRPATTRHQGEDGELTIVLPEHAQRLPTLEEVRRQYIELVLKETKGNKKRTAEILGIGRRTLYDYL
jgi:DNA-binding NtrC family response regulator